MPEDPSCMKKRIGREMFMLFKIYFKYEKLVTVP